MRNVVVWCGTSNVYPYMAASARSVLQRVRGIDKIYFMIETDEFSEPLPDIVECININDTPYLDPKGVNFINGWTWMTMARLALHRLLPDEDRVLYLDCDVIAMFDFSEIFDIDLQGNVLAAVREPARCKNPFIYFNAGVLLMDLAKLREGIGDEMLHMANTKKLACPDQDAINLLCQGRILELPPTYNSSEWTSQPMDAKTTHYAGVKRYWEHKLFREYLNMKWSEIYARKK